VTIAVIIPALNEAAEIATCIGGARAADEIVVVDGGSADETVAVAEAAGARVIAETGGRGLQQNAGAAATEADVLLFLHADTRLPGGWADIVKDTLGDEAVALGAFSLSIGDAGPAERLVARGANLRSRLFHRPYGDQALFMRRKTFDTLGGFTPLPIMEDLDLVERAALQGRIVTRSEAVVTSARRWQRVGPLRTTAINQAMLIGRALGLSPDRLAVLYRGARRP
jgi:rSAM/selenodomain-associated transferase 2